MKSFFTIVFCLISNVSYSQTWMFNSTSNGYIPIPWQSTEQTASLLTDIDNDGADDIVLANRKSGPSLIWYKKSKSRYEKKIIESEMLTIEAGGVSYDIDKDGDQDLLFGGDWQSTKIWWWENPYPDFAKKWNRYEVKNDGLTQHHDQVIGDFKKTGKPQLVFWNQGSKSLFIADIPSLPKEVSSWPYELIFSGQAGEKDSWYAEGLASDDIDGDGWTDLVAGNYWFKFENNSFKKIKIGESGGRVVIGKFKPGRSKQIIISPGDGTGNLMYYEWTGVEDEDKIDDETKWKGTDLLGRTMIHGHTMDIGDLNNDGNLDFFTAEMIKWSESKLIPDNPVAEAFIYYGNGDGTFKKTVFKKGWGFHEGKLGDIDGDGDLDIISKPYNWKTPRLDIWLQNGSQPKLNLPVVTSSKIGLEIYSLRNELEKDLEGSLKKIKEMGFTEVELPGYYGKTPIQMLGLLEKYGLKATGALFPYDRFINDVDNLIKEAKLLGLKQIGCAWIPHKRYFLQEDADKGIKVFNEAGTKLKAQGITFYYHTHGYEFRPMKDFKMTLFDYMAKGLKPGVADFQIDVYWAYHGGQDPASLLRKYKGRIRSLHLKDMAWGQEHGIYSGGAPISNDCIHGSGQQDFEAILKAAIQTGVKHYYIEDENLNAVNQLPESLKYLKSLK